MATQESNLNKRQLAVINDLFSGNLDQDAVLKKHKLSRNIFQKWMTDKKFAKAFHDHSNIAFRQSEMILARYAPLAAARLVELASNGTGETARKACLDIISTHSQFANQQDPAEQDEAQAEQPPQFSNETASKLLAILAEDKVKT